MLTPEFRLEIIIRPLRRMWSIPTRIIEQPQSVFLLIMIFRMVIIHDSTTLTGALISSLFFRVRDCGL
jgi:hypothetical protein